MNIIDKSNIDFISKSKYTLFISLGIIIMGIGALIFRGPNLSIDFVGGTIIQVSSSEQVEINIIRDLLDSTVLKNSEITEITGLSSNQQFRIKTNIKIEDTTEISNIIMNTLKDFNPEIRAIESVGPKVGKELQFQAIYAIGLALLMLMIYIGFRFDQFYAMGSVVAVIHDILITLGIFSLLNLEINLSIVAAFLTIVGYSLNDTIVIFDRFRENSQKDLKISLTDLANLSLNQTLSRTIITSLTTLMVVTILFFVGGEAIKYFAFALIIGVIVGTYSSMFIASPFLLYFKSKIKTEEE
ncbi:MAG: protein translocase subunit SecF [Candidatus Marinimicrobia bacterium]|nr:protein translocase subunit SecF [Candidatus Neomarinimicrobiota bacterium]|tara:strand:+ start:857 stop:1753 length:897 start_codon:yes stop_codon:yes gene_type:complete